MSLLSNSDTRGIQTTSRVAIFRAVLRPGLVTEVTVSPWGGLERRTFKIEWTSYILNRMEDQDPDHGAYLSFDITFINTIQGSIGYITYPHLVKDLELLRLRECE